MFTIKINISLRYFFLLIKVLGDQQAALVGQLCWEKGSAKNTLVNK